MWHVYVHSIYRDCMYTWDVIMITKALLSPSCILANHPGYPLDVWLSNLWSFKHVKPLLVFHWYPFLAGYSATGQDDHHWLLNSSKGLKHVEITKHNQSCLRLIGIPGVHQVIKSRWGIRNPNHQPKPRAIRFWLKQQMFDASLPPNIKHPSRNLVLPMSSTGSTHIWDRLGGAWYYGDGSIESSQDINCASFRQVDVPGQPGSLCWSHQKNLGKWLATTNRITLIVNTAHFYGPNYVEIHYKTMVSNFKGDV